MKLLTKVKVINWHYFWNETIHIEPIVFLTGLNASGKSTLIDAMQVVLLGDTSGRNFNKAASEKSTRTLKGYLRGELGDVEEGGFHYLRNGRFTSYIALQFMDDKTTKSFTVGIVFDSFEDGSEDHRFFLLDDAIPENDFVKNNVPMDYKTLVAYFDEKNPLQYQFFDSNHQYQEAIKRKFGGLKDRYFSLLKKAVSFTPITDIETFITEYVCDPQAGVDILPMQENILQYKKLENEALVMGVRIERLTEIQHAYQAYVSHQENMTLFSFIVEKAEYQIDKERLESYYDQIAKAKARLIDIEVDLADATSDIADLNKKKVKLIQEKASSDTYRLTDELNEQKAETTAHLAALNKEAETVKKNLGRYVDEFIAVSANIVKTLESFDVDLLDADKANDVIALKEAAAKVQSTSLQLRDVGIVHIETLTSASLMQWRDALSLFKQLVSALSVSIGRTIVAADQKTSLLRQQEADMRNGGKSYERSLALIKQELATELALRHKKTIEVAIYADLIDIKNPLWANAVEGFLHSQKFNLFVEPAYYFEAYEILKELLLKYHYYGTTLVDQEKIIERRYLADANSLAEEITTDHVGARGYTNFLIGRLNKCKTVEQARESGNGITPEGDLYRNFTLGRMNPKLFYPAYIGRSIGVGQIDAKHLEIEKNAKLVSLYRELFKAISTANSMEIINTYEINSTLALVERSADIAGLKQTLDFIERELAKHDLSQIATFDKRIADIDEDLKGVDAEKSALLEEKGNLLSQIKMLSATTIPEDKKKVQEREKRLEENYDPFFIEEKGLPLYGTLVESAKTALEIVTEYNIKFGHAQYLVSNLLSQVYKIRKDYVRDYRLSYDSETKDNLAYDNELQEMRDVKLPEYRLKIADSYRRATKQFKDDFISKLRAAIENVEDQIKDLNDALGASMFGEDTYRFTVKPSVVYRRYYDMIKDELLLQVGEDDSAFIDKYSAVMNDLFRQIVDVGEADKSGAILANVEKFTDYRSYLDFDLIVKDRQGSEQRLSKMIKKKSGGETQTPFYIAVLASFAQLYRVSEKGELSNSIRLIIFDEAFSKMDRGRIKESIRLLRKFGLQAVLSAPSDKVADISEVADETLVVLHDHNTSRVRLYAEMEKLSGVK